MKKIVTILLILTLIVAAFSCTKEKIQEPAKQSTPLQVRVQSVDNDESTQESNITITYINQ